MGTMLRLRIAPLGGASLLAGKALACFLTAIGVMVMMTVLGLMLGMRPASYGKLVVAGLCIAAAFTGIMMVVSLLGRTEQGVSGAGWAANLIMAMLGGCMVPVMFMPQWVQSASVVSPVRWAILAIEGAVWREFSWPEMALPLLVLLVTGGVCFAIGTFMFRTKQDVFV